MSSLHLAKRVFPLLMMLGLLSASVLAQTSGSLSGTVQDAQGGSQSNGFRCYPQFST